MNITEFVTLAGPLLVLQGFAVPLGVLGLGIAGLRWVRRVAS